MKEKLRVGIIGFGRMGITHYSIINSHPEVEITCVADSSGVVLSILKKYVPGTNIYQDYKELLKNEKLDAALVCTPPNLHYPILKACAEKMIHVFVEKPYTTSFREAKELAGIFGNKQLVNQVGYVNRYNDVFVKARSFVMEKLIGDVVRFRSEMYSNTVSESAKHSGWRATRESGGGVVYEMASHSIDLVNYIFGNPQKVTGTSMSSVYSRDIEDVVSSTFLYSNGVSGSIYVNWCDSSYRKPSNSIEIFGTGGKILANQHSMKIFLKEEKKEHNLRSGWNTLYITDMFKPVPFYVRGNEFTAQLYDFIHCIETSEATNLCSFSQGSDTLDVIERMFKDFKTNGRV